jgi:hypothetical protein
MHQLSMEISGSCSGVECATRVSRDQYQALRKVLYRGGTTTIGHERKMRPGFFLKVCS